MSMHDLTPQPDDWVVDIESHGRLNGNRLWGQCEELAERLMENVHLLGGTPAPAAIPRLIEQLNALETTDGMRYVVVQAPGSV